MDFVPPISVSNVIFLMKTHCVIMKIERESRDFQTTHVLIVAVRPHEAPLCVVEVEAAGHPGDLPLAVHQHAGQVVAGLRLGLRVVMVTLGLKYSA